VIAVPSPEDRPTAAAAQRAIEATGIVGIVRAPDCRHVDAVVDVLVEEGVRAVEVTFTTSGALDAVARLAERYGGAALVGAGTVTTAAEATAAIDAGASFLVSPAVCPDVIATAVAAGVAVVPGAFTPTEVLAAHRAGATSVKVFPAGALGPRYLTDLHGPLPDVPLVPTGRIGIEEIPAWLQAGAVAVGLGSPLLGRCGSDGPDDGLRERARAAVAQVAKAREHALG
jgi:2-dehydro-3-deoxyphosphogluconate aldolase/(4S)-4-hydroxy-2-oxoglutarate aldolase